MIMLGAFVIAALVIRAAGQKHAATVSAAKSADTPSPNEDTERLVRVLRTIDKNQAARFADLKLFLFFLPLIWGVISGILYAILLALR